MIHTIYTHISRRGGMGSCLLPMLALVGGLKLMMTFYL